LSSSLISHSMAWFSSKSVMRVLIPIAKTFLDLVDVTTGLTELEARA
jgi:hypothetical protein